MAYEKTYENTTLEGAQRWAARVAVERDAKDFFYAQTKAANTALLPRSAARAIFTSIPQIVLSQLVRAVDAGELQEPVPYEEAKALLQPRVNAKITYEITLAIKAFVEGADVFLTEGIPPPAVSAAEATTVDDSGDSGESAQAPHKRLREVSRHTRKNAGTL
jgi:hypothetical protein